MYSSHRYSTVLANHVFSTTAKKQTNTHLGARPTRIGESQKLITGNMAMFRVKFTLIKLQEDVSKNGAETNYSDSENHIKS